MRCPANFPQIRAIGYSGDRFAQGPIGADGQIHQNTAGAGWPLPGADLAAPGLTPPADLE